MNSQQNKPLDHDRDFENEITMEEIEQVKQSISSVVTNAEEAELEIEQQYKQEFDKLGIR